jgi:hypothetical protein
MREAIVMIEIIKRFPFDLFRLLEIGPLEFQYLYDDLTILPGGGSRTLSLCLRLHENSLSYERYEYTCNLSPDDSVK